MPLEIPNMLGMATRTLSNPLTNLDNDQHDDHNNDDDDDLQSSTSAFPYYPDGASGEGEGRGHDAFACGSNNLEDLGKAIRDLEELP